MGTVAEDLYTILPGRDQYRTLLKSKSITPGSTGRDDILKIWRTIEDEKQLPKFI